MSVSIPEVTSGFSIFGFEITNTIVWTWIILGALSVLFIWLGSGLKVKPESKKQISGSGKTSRSLTLAFPWGKVARP